jgi:hypothetical protein
MPSRLQDNFPSRIKHRVILRVGMTRNVARNDYGIKSMICEEKRNRINTVKSDFMVTWNAQYTTLMLQRRTAE